MKKQTGTVISKNGYRATVKVANEEQTIDAFNSLRASVGDTVQIAWQTTDQKKNTWLLLLIPIVAAVAGAFLGYRLPFYMKTIPVSDLVLYSSLVWFILGSIYSFRYWYSNRGRDEQPTIVKIN